MAVRLAAAAKPTGLVVTRWLLWAFVTVILDMVVAPFPRTPLSLAVIALFVVACGGAPAAQPSGDTDGLADHAIELDGLNDYATSGLSQFPVARNPQTVSLWFNARATVERQVLVCVRKEGESGYALGLSDGAVQAWSYADRALFEGSEGRTIEPGRWYHLAMVTDGEQRPVLFLDGSPIETGPAEPNGSRSPTSSFLGTDDGWGRLFGGKLDEVRVWTDARSEAQLRDEFEGLPLDDQRGLVAYWSFDESSGARVYDHSGVGNHASLGDGVPEYTPLRVLSDTPIARR